MIALRRRRILARLLLALLRLLLLLLLLELIAATVRRKRLAIGAIELCICWWLLSTPNSVGRHESLSLRAHWGEDTFLRESLTVGAATILRLIKARTTNLYLARELHISGVLG
jgi:hypothetical protein